MAVKNGAILAVEREQICPFWSLVLGGISSLTWLWKPEKTQSDPNYPSFLPQCFPVDHSSPLRFIRKGCHILLQNHHEQYRSAALRKWAEDKLLDEAEIAIRLLRSETISHNTIAESESNNAGSSNEDTQDNAAGIDKPVRISSVVDPGIPYSEAAQDSPDLWPFFSERIQDFRRPEIRAWMRLKKLSEADDIRMLAELSAHSVTDPYEIRLAAA